MNSSTNRSALPRSKAAVMPLAAAFCALCLCVVPSHAQTPPSSGESTEKLEEVSVTGYRIASGSVGSVVDAPIQEVPRNVVVVTEKMLTNQMVDNSLDILKNFAGVQRGGDGPGGEHPRMRGQGAYQFLEGTFSGNVIWDSAEFLGSAEVLSGPNSIQFGFLNQGGGTVNYRLKRPATVQFVDATLKGSMWGDYKIVIDANMPIGGRAGDGVRLVAVNEDAPGYRRGIQYGERRSASVMATYSGLWGIKADFDAQWMHRRAAADSNIYFSTNPTTDLPNLNPRNTTEQPWEHLDRDAYRLGGKFTRNLAHNWYAVASISYEDQDVLNKSCSLTDPNFATGESSYSCGTFGFKSYSNRSLRFDVQGKFHTFGWLHSIAIGASQLRQHILLPRTFDSFSGAPPLNAQNVYVPRYYPDPTVPTSQSVFGDGVRLTQWWTQAYFQDQIAVTTRTQVWLGANFGRYYNQGGSPAGLSPRSPNFNGVSPTASISFAPTKQIHFYATYADNISPGGTAPLDPRYVNAGEHFPTLRLKSYEVGEKWQWNATSLLNVAIFRSDQPAEYTKVLSPNVFLYTQSGLSQFTGVEVTTVSNFASGLQLNGGVTLLRPIKKETGNPLLDGQYTAGVSRVSVSVSAEYAIRRHSGLILTGDVRHDSSTPLLETGGFDVPGHTLLGLGARYEFSHNGVPLTIRAAVENLLDERYYSPYVSGVVLGAPRTLYVSMTARLGAH
jgi:iron complex outermembrane recepter protein